MEIRALGLRITQDELNGWMDRFLANNSHVRGLTLEIAGEKLTVRGEAFVMRMWLPFEADLEPDADGPLVMMRLAAVRAGGFIPVPLSMIMGELEKHQKEWLRIREETVVVNVEMLLETYGMAVTLNLCGARCEGQAVLLESAAPAA